MTKKTVDYIQSIRAGLESLPAGPVNQALEYYEEYIADALEAGLSGDEIVAKLGSSEKIVAAIRAEVLINDTEKKPGPVRLMRASGNAFRQVADSAAKASLIMGAIIPIAVAILFYIVSVATFIGAIALTAILVYGMLQIPVIYMAEKFGTAGFALFISVLLVATGIGWWYLANSITRVTMKALRKLTQQTKELPIKNPALSTPNLVMPLRRFSFKKRLPVLLGIGLLGAVLLFSSGLPLRYFSIWNSMKPANLTRLQKEFEPQTVRNISVTTLNSRIVVQQGNTAGLAVSYEQPDWMSGAIEFKDDTLIFRERSNGRLPFMDFIAIHEGMTTVTIEIPEGYVFNNVSLESTGGHITTAIFAKEVRVHTFNGNIRFNSTNRMYTIKVSAPAEKIYVGGVPLEPGSIIDGRLKNRQAILESDNGTIEIDVK